MVILAYLTNYLLGYICERLKESWIIMVDLNIIIKFLLVFMVISITSNFTIKLIWITLQVVIQFYFTKVLSNSYKQSKICLDCNKLYFIILIIFNYWQFMNIVVIDIKVVSMFIELYSILRNYFNLKMEKLILRNYFNLLMEKLTLVIIFIRN